MRRTGVARASARSSYFNPRIPYGMRLGFNAAANAANISIHASRMGCDLAYRYPVAGSMDFNPRIPYGMRPSCLVLVNGLMQISIHASRMGCDWDNAAAKVDTLVFQSTHPVWDATSKPWAIVRLILFQSTHPVWDATIMWAVRHGFVPISIHASRMGCDRCPTLIMATRPYFNPRIPYGMRQHRRWQSSPSANFNPRIPYGMRLFPMCLAMGESIFQSTHPVWDATPSA